MKNTHETGKLTVLRLKPSSGLRMFFYDQGCRAWENIKQAFRRKAEYHKKRVVTMWEKKGSWVPLKMEREEI